MAVEFAGGQPVQIQVGFDLRVKLLMGVRALVAANDLLRRFTQAGWSTTPPVDTPVAVDADHAYRWSVRSGVPPGGTHGGPCPRPGAQTLRNGAVLGGVGGGRAGEAIPFATVALGLAHPLPQRLGWAANLAGNSADRSPPPPRHFAGLGRRQEPDIGGLAMEGRRGIKVTRRFG